MKKRKVTPVLKKKRISKSPVKFLITFLLSLFGGCLIYYFVKADYHSVVDQATSLTASIVAVILNLLGMSVSSEASLVKLEGYRFQVIEECLGLFEILIFSAGVFAYPTRNKNKLVGIFLGIPFIYTVNVIRLSILGVVGRWSPNISEIMHEYLWQIIIFLTVLLTCVLWIKLVVQPGERRYSPS